SGGLRNGDSPGVEDSFSELGGDSLSALWVIAKVNKALGLELPAR
ncbi:phosphopantetheine-binding protein, partial [Mycobacterium marinum]